MTAPLPDNALTEEERDAIRVAIANGYHDHTAGDKVAAVVASIKAAARAEVEELRKQRDDAQFFANQYKTALHNLSDRDREHMQKIAAERDAARKDADELRGRVSALAEQYEKDADESDNYGGELFSTTASALRAALAGGDSDVV